MKMVSCPHCGADNSEKRDKCYQCEQDLAAPPKPKTATGLEHKFCVRATPYPPPGKKLGPDEMWCADFDKPVKSDEDGPAECFKSAFKWERTEAL
jgi:hypothetical protein